MRVLADDNLTEYIAHVGDWLARDPVRNNLKATLLDARVSGRVLDGDEIAGIAMRTPLVEPRQTARNPRLAGRRSGRR